VAACADSTDGMPAFACPELAATADGARLRTERCDDALELTARVRFDDRWRAVTACDGFHEVVSCQVGGGGALTLSLDGGLLPRFTPDRAGVFGGFELTTTADVP